MPPHPPAEAARLLRDLAARWRESTLGEKQAFQHWFLEFCDALGAARPSPNAADDYCFEKSVHLQRTDWTDGVGRIDCWKAGHVAIEAKGSGGKGSSEIHLRKAFKQLSDYVAAEPGPMAVHAGRGTDAACDTAGPASSPQPIRKVAAHPAIRVSTRAA